MKTRFSAFVLCALTAAFFVMGCGSQKPLEDPNKEGSKPVISETGPTAQKLNAEQKARADALNRSNLPPEAKAMEMGRVQKR